MHPKVMHLSFLFLLFSITYPDHKIVIAGRSLQVDIK